MNLKPFFIILAAIGIIAVQAGILFMLGRPLVCPCGSLKLWGQLHTIEDSQMVFDWYSLVHLGYGMFLYFVLWFLNKKLRWKVWILFLIIVAIAAGWEIFENTHYILYNYQDAVIFYHYYGDSIVNSVMDTVSLAVGFSLAYLLPTSMSLLIFMSISFITTFTAHDNVFLSALSLFFPGNFLSN